MLPPRKPRLTPEVLAELQLIGIEELRRKWQTPRIPTIPLRNDSISRVDLEKWIRWLEWREKVWNWIIALMTFAAMVAAIVAAFEGWR